MNALPLATDYVPRYQVWRRLLWIAWTVMLVLGTIGLIQRFVQGHLPAGYGSYVPWGLWIAIYFHGVGMAGGAFFIGALGYLLGWPGFQRGKNLRLVIVLALSAIVPAFVAVGLDLGHMLRFPSIFLHPSFTSMMAFNAWMYSAFVVVAGVCWWLSYLKDAGLRPSLTGWLKPLLSLAIVFAMLFPSQSGAFFGVVGAKPYWHSALLPVLFLTSALTSGAALLLFARVLTNAAGGYQVTPQEQAEEHWMMNRLRIWLVVGLITYVGFEFAEFSIAFWSPTSHAPALELV
ncbi:MAG: NrfD/PsrC family molybdoenzyme membrane anchor subunit, partial [Gemmatimonadales bacterium]